VIGSILREGVEDANKLAVARILLRDEEVVHATVFEPIEEGTRRRAIAPRTTDLLEVALHRVRHVVVNDEAHVALSTPIPKAFVATITRYRPSMNAFCVGRAPASRKMVGRSKRRLQSRPHIDHASGGAATARMGRVRNPPRRRDHLTRSSWVTRE
jgi:hypothetical protein